MATAAVLATIAVIGYSGHEKLAAESEAYRAGEAYDSGNKSGALQHAERAAALHPSTFYGNYLIGAIYIENHKYQESVPFLEKANQLQPENPAVKAALAEARRGEK